MIKDRHKQRGTMVQSILPVWEVFDVVSFHETAS